MKEFSDKTCREIPNTNFMLSNIYFNENHAVYEVMWGKYCRAGQATDDYNMAPAHYIPHT
jgi:hypothetical protein